MFNYLPIKTRAEYSDLGIGGEQFYFMLRKEYTS
jgi:hypothetical protein